MTNVTAQPSPEAREAFAEWEACWKAHVEAANHEFATGRTDEASKAAIEKEEL